jgi:hypothetical protein
MKAVDLTRFGKAWPLTSRWRFALSGAGAAATSALLAFTLWEIASAYGWSPIVAPLGALGLVGLAAPVYVGKYQELFRCGPQGSKKHGFTIAKMPVDWDDMRTSILVTGVTGSSKTAGVLMPALAQLFNTYNEETEDELSTDEFQKAGAFIPEVKGDLVDGCIYLAHEAGRCVSRDVLIVTPNCRIPVVRYRDEQGRFWHLSARGGAGGSDAGAFLPRLHFPPGHHRAGRLVPNNVFEYPADLAAVMPEMSKATVRVSGMRLRFVGWRWEGHHLRRVSHTVARDKQVLLEGQGEYALVDPPNELTIDGVGHIDNGIHYNLVDPRLPASEAAERVTRLAAMARNAGSRGENDYFYEQGRKVIAAAISLHRAVELSQCTAIDIVRLATQDQRLSSALARLGEKIKLLREEATACPQEDLRNDILRRQVAPLEDLVLFFREEWQKLVEDGKTANIIRSTISGAFDVFLQDPNLAESFCQPATFSFEDIVQFGKIIGLVPGDQYEQLGRVLGTACKMDFQSAMLSRNGRADLNSARLAVYFADECHKYIISGSSTAGDPYFMNLSRSNNVVNFCATQSYAWIVEVIGREAANVYISAFGVQFWLQQTDPETSRRASEICGNVTEEKVSADHNVDFAGLLSVLGSGQGMVVRHRVREEEKERYPPEDFSHLNVGDIISYNKGRKGKRAKVTKGKAEYIFCTERPKGLAAVNERVREYYREILENLTHERGQSARWNCVPRLSSAAVSEGTAIEAPSPPKPAYKSVLPLTPGFSAASRPVVEIPGGTETPKPINKTIPAHQNGAVSPPNDPPKPVADCKAGSGGGGLTPAQVDKERADYQKYMGSLDGCMGEMSRVDPRSLAPLCEEARRRALKAPNPAIKYGESLTAGPDGLTSDDPENPIPPVASVPPDTSGQPSSGDLVKQYADDAHQARAKHESKEAAQRRQEADRPRPKRGAMPLKEMEDLIF